MASGKMIYLNGNPIALNKISTKKRRFK